MKIEAYGLITRVWTKRDDYGYGCSECCTGDRCDEDCDAPYKGRRSQCPHCKGRGWIPLSDGTLIETPPSHDGATAEHERAQQELQAYRDIIRELLPLAEERLRRIVNYDMPDYYKVRSGIQSTISKARKLIDTVTPI